MRRKATSRRVNGWPSPQPLRGVVVSIESSSKAVWNSSSLPLTAPFEWKGTVVYVNVRGSGRFALKEKALDIPIKMSCQLEQRAEEPLRLRELLRHFAASIPEVTEPPRPGKNSSWPSSLRQRPRVSR